MTFFRVLILAVVNMKDEKAAVGLKRNIGLLSATNIIIGVMIGSGIFVSPTAALRYAGSIWCCLIVWIVCGVISLLGKDYTQLYFDNVLI